MTTTLFVVRIRLVHLSTFNDKLAIFAGSVLLLIPLEFSISLKTLFENPVLWVRATVLIEFISPHEFVTFVFCRLSMTSDGQHQGKEEVCDEFHGDLKLRGFYEKNILAA